MSALTPMKSDSGDANDSEDDHSVRYGNFELGNGMLQKSESGEANDREFDNDASLRSAGVRLRLLSDLCSSPTLAADVEGRQDCFQILLEARAVDCLVRAEIMVMVVVVVFLCMYVLCDKDDADESFDL